MADVLKVTNQLALNWGDYSGLSGKINLITEPLKAEIFLWPVAEKEVKDSKDEKNVMCHFYLKIKGATC